MEVLGKQVQTHRIPGGHSLAISFPKEKVEEQVQDWIIKPASLEQGMLQQLPKAGNGDAIRLPQLASSAPVANFLGARIENLVNERYSRELLVYFERGKRAESDAAPVPAVQDLPRAARLASPGKDCWYTAHFSVAYVQSFIPPAPNDHNYISLNFARPGEVSAIKVWLNGKEAPVETFQYWRGPAGAKNYYIDGTTWIEAR